MQTVHRSMAWFAAAMALVSVTACGGGGGDAASGGGGSGGAASPSASPSPAPGGGAAPSPSPSPAPAPVPAPPPAGTPPAAPPPGSGSAPIPDPGAGTGSTPFALSITAVPQRGLKLDWTAVAGADYYRIDRDVDASDGVDNFGSGALGFVPSLAPPTRTFTDLRLTEAMNHKYRVSAMTPSGAVLSTAVATVSGDLAAAVDSLSNPVDDAGGNRARAMATALRDQDVVRHVLAVGLPGANQGMGLVKVYERAPFGGAWTEVQTLSLPQAALGDFFGASVALSPNGLYLAVGVPGDDHATAGTGVNPQPSALARDVQDSGAVQVYQYVAGQGWTPDARFKAINAGAGDAFGTAVAISNDGNLLVGAPNEDSAADPGVYQPSSADAPELGDGPSNRQDRGAVYAYVNTGQGYAFDAYVKPYVTDASQSSMYFGASLAMDAAGQRVAVGAPRASYDGALAGGVSFYRVSWGPQGDPPWTRWNLLQTFGPGGDRSVDASTSPLSPAYRGLGGALSMSTDGNWLAAGYAEKGGLVPQTGQTLPANAGQVAVYRYQNNTWAWHSSPVAPAPRANDRFGTSLALVNGANGPQLLVGAPEDGAPHKGVMRAADIVPVNLPSPAEAGAAYCFVGNASDPSRPLTLKARLKSPDPQNQQWLGQATALTQDGNEFLLSGMSDGDPRALFPNVIFFGY